MFMLGTRALCRMVLKCAWISLTLYGCGGGGGGGGSGGGASSSTSSATGSISVTPSSLTFVADGASAPTPAPKLIVGTVTGVTSGTLYILVTGTGSAIASISSVTLVNQTTGQALVSVPAPSALGVGTHTGTITVRACLNDPTCSGSSLQGSPQTINVTYHVATLLVAPASIGYVVNNTPAPIDLSRNMTVTTTPAMNWIGYNSGRWLATPATGSSGVSFDAALRQDVVSTMPNGSYVEGVGFDFLGGMGYRWVPVSLTIKRTQINHVSPYVVYAGSASDVIIRGEEFSQVTIQNVLFGSLQADSFSLASPTEIRARVPASLPKGRHTVKLQSNYADVRQFAEVVVVDAPQFSSTVLSYPNTNNKVVNAVQYDAERAALVVSVWYPETGATDLIRFSSSGNAWQPALAKSITSHYGLALSADGTEWIAGSSKSIVHLNATTLDTVTTVASPLDVNSSPIIAEMATANDGMVAMFGDVYFNCGASLMFYDPRKRIFSFPSTVYSTCRGNVGASADGSRVLLANQFVDFSTDDVSVLDTSTRMVTTTGVHMLTAATPRMDRTGSRIVLNKTQVYGGSYNFLGALPATTDAVVLSPNGTRAYTFERAGLFRTFDLTSPLVSGVFPEVGSAVVLSPTPTVSNSAPLYTDYGVVMAITPDGRTVFIAASNAAYVRAVP